MSVHNLEHVKGKYFWLPYKQPLDICLAEDRFKMDYD